MCDLAHKFLPNVNLDIKMPPIMQKKKKTKLLRKRVTETWRKKLLDFEKKLVQVYPLIAVLGLRNGQKVREGVE